MSLSATSNSGNNTNQSSFTSMSTATILGLTSRRDARSPTDAETLIRTATPSITRCKTRTCKGITGVEPRGICLNSPSCQGDVTLSNSLSPDSNTLNGLFRTIKAPNKSTALIMSLTKPLECTSSTSLVFWIRSSRSSTGSWHSSNTHAVKN